MSCRPIKAGDFVRLLPTVERSPVPEGREDGTVAQVRAALDNGVLHLENDLNGLRWWNASDVERVELSARQWQAYSALSALQPGKWMDAYTLCGGRAATRASLQQLCVKGIAQARYPLGSTAFPGTTQYRLVRASK